MTGIYWLLYEKTYQEALENYGYELEAEAENVAVWSQRYEYQLEVLKEKEEAGELEDKEALLKETELLAKVWSDYYANIKYLGILWQNFDLNEEKIQTTEAQMDLELLPVYEQHIYMEESRLFRDYPRQWNQRILLREGYGGQLDLVTNRPDGAYVVSQALKGTSFAGIVLLSLIAFLNFDIWAKDFEEETDRLIFTLPYSKRRIYACRFFVRFLFTIGSVVLCLLVLFGWGCIRYGLGLERLFVVYEPVLKGMGYFVALGTEVATDIVVSAGTYILCELLLYLFYTFFLYALVQLVSFVTKNQMTSLLLCIVGIIILVTDFLLPKKSFSASKNIFRLVAGESLMEGTLGLSLWMAVFLLCVTGVVLLFISLFAVSGFHRKNTN
jgi:ABC-type transport system involved in multi-copper enzyme maturation permease subunit